jgi:hypothetical protein
MGRPVRLKRSGRRSAEPGWGFVIGIVLLVGIPTLAAAWNKDLILFLIEVYVWTK